MPTKDYKNPDDFRGQKFYVGIDVHKKSWAVTVRSLSFVVDHFSTSVDRGLLSHLQRDLRAGSFTQPMKPTSSG